MDKEINKQLYAALTRRDNEAVKQWCQCLEDGPLHRVSVHGDTVLHMAAYSKQLDLFLELLKMVPTSNYANLTLRNETKDTILHELATANEMVPAAKGILRKAPELLTMPSAYGETVIFRAATYGAGEMFEFLDEEFAKNHPTQKELEDFHTRKKVGTTIHMSVSADHFGEMSEFLDEEFAKNDPTQKELEDFHKRDNGGTTLHMSVSTEHFGEMSEFLDEEFAKNHPTQKELEDFHKRDNGGTTLHMSVSTEHFDLALQIATRHKYLVGKRDEAGMTALQHLACNPSAFYSASKHGRIKKFIYSCLSTAHPLEEKAQPCYIVPLVESIRSEKQRYESAHKLAKFLIERDTSWESSASGLIEVDPKTHEYGPPTWEEVVRKEERNKIAETPLILATKSGSLEIVEEILKAHPQAIEHIEDQGRNILHVAIKYRQINIFNFVEKLEFPMTRLARKIDIRGNTILHMVGKKEENQTKKDLRNPALRLEENLLLFERVEKICTAFHRKVINHNGKTAEKVFAEGNAELHSEAKEWLKRTAENCSIVAVLIATVAFAAAYTVPGGPNQSTGFPVLLNQPFFITFIIADVLSLTYALTSVVTFLSILTSPFQLMSFKRSLPQALMLGVTLLILSVSMMMLAFGATIILTLRNKQQWTKIVLYAMAFLPVLIFVASYLPLYVALWRNLKESLWRLRDVFPRCTRRNLLHSPSSEECGDYCV